MTFQAMGWNARPFLTDEGGVNEEELEKYFFSKSRNLQERFILNYPQLFTKEFREEFQKKNK